LLDRTTEALHEGGPVAGRRSAHIGPCGQGRTDHSQLVERLPALRAGREVPLGLDVRQLVELAVKIQFDGAGRL
jgi:hypothetical protein